MKTTLKVVLFKTYAFLFFISFLLLSCEARKDTHDRKPDVSKPEETISLDRALEMYASYQPRYDALTKFRDGKEDARYGWHSLDFYKKYIDYLEYESAKVGIKVSGIRLYYAAYPEDNESGDQAGYQTYLYVPTYYDEESGKHIAFDPLHIDDSGKPKRIHDIITKEARVGNPNQSSSLVYVKNQDVESSIANMAQMCQPNCSE